MAYNAKGNTANAPSGGDLVNIIDILICSLHCFSIARSWKSLNQCRLDDVG